MQRTGRNPLAASPESNWLVVVQTNPAWRLRRGCNRHKFLPFHMPGEVEATGIELKATLKLHKLLIFRTGRIAKMRAFGEAGSGKLTIPSSMVARHPELLEAGDRGCLRIVNVKNSDQPCQL